MDLRNAIVARPPFIYRLCFPEAIWRIKRAGRKMVYLTFDDGPVPEATPAILDLLRSHDIKATFFMVGDNARRYPYLLDRVRAEGHSIGNHTMHHLQGAKTPRKRYLRDILEAQELLRSDLFRPPHGWIRFRQGKALKSHFNIVMHDVVTRDYARHITPEQVVDNVRRFTRNGSIIVFHDSERTAPVTLAALPAAIEWLKANGYEFGQL